jgi:hypothetical protein
MTIDKILRGKQMQMMVKVDISMPALVHCVQTSLHVCGIEHVMFVM